MEPWMCDGELPVLGYETYSVPSLSPSFARRGYATYTRRRTDIQVGGRSVRGIEAR